MAIAGLQPVEGVWVQLWQLAPVLEGHGVLWGQCGMWQLTQWYQWCSVGVPAPAKFLARALWQQFCGSRLWGQWRGLGGTTGGIKCDPEVNLQTMP